MANVEYRIVVRFLFFQQKHTSKSKFPNPQVTANFFAKILADDNEKRVKFAMPALPCRSNIAI